MSKPPVVAGHAAGTFPRHVAACSPGAHDDPSRPPRWFFVAAALGLAWNVFGVVQFVGSLRSSADDLMTMGLTAEQAQVMSSTPAWMTAAFATGVCGGLLGCVLLLLRRRAALPVFVASLVGYVVLFVGDVTEGVFEALGFQQAAILTTVVVIAAALLWLTRRAERHAHLLPAG